MIGPLTSAMLANELCRGESVPHSRFGILYRHGDAAICCRKVVGDFRLPLQLLVGLQLIRGHYDVRKRRKKGKTTIPTSTSSARTPFTPGYGRLCVVIPLASYCGHELIESSSPPLVGHEKNSKNCPVYWSITSYASTVCLQRDRHYRGVIAGGMQASAFGNPVSDIFIFSFFRSDTDM